MELHPILEHDTPPNPGMWYVLSAMGDCPSQRVGHTCSYMQSSDGKNGRLYVIGGASPSGSFKEVYTLDLSTFSWDIIDTPGFKARYEHAAFVPQSQPANIYIFGGADQGGNNNDVQMFNTDTHEWSTVSVSGTPPSPRTFHTSACSGDKFIVYSGGHAGVDPVSDRQVYCFDATTSTWSILNIRGDSPKPRHGHVMVAIGNKVFVHGGMSGTTFYSDLHMLDLEKNTWTNIKQKKVCPSPRAAHGSVVIGNNVYVFGGMNRDGALDDMYKLDTECLKWSKVELQGPPPANRLDFAVCAMKFPVTSVPGAAASNSQEVISTGHRAREIIDAHMRMGSAGSRGSSAGSRDERQGSGSSHDRLSSAGSTQGRMSSAGSTRDRINSTGLGQDRIGMTPSAQGDGAITGAAQGASAAVTNSDTEGSAAMTTTAHLVDMFFVLGGMDTEGEIFEDCLAIIPS